MDFAYPFRVIVGSQLTARRLADLESRVKEEPRERVTILGERISVVVSKTADKLHETKWIDEGPSGSMTEESKQYDLQGRYLGTYTRSYSDTGALMHEMFTPPKF